MDITLPAIPAGILTLLATFAPYAIAALNGALGWVKSSAAKKVVTVVVAVLLAAIVTFLYYAWTGDAIPAWPVMIVLSLLVVSASYALLVKKSASKVEAKVEASKAVD